MEDTALCKLDIFIPLLQTAASPISVSDALDELYLELLIHPSHPA